MASGSFELREENWWGCGIYYQASHGCEVLECWYFLPCASRAELESADPLAGISLKRCAIARFTLAY